MGWTTERPKEAGEYYFKYPDGEIVTVYVQRFGSEKLRVQMAGGIQSFDGPEFDKCQWLRIPSPDHLAALERLAEATLELERLKYGDGIGSSAEISAAVDRHTAALDAVKEATK